ncbi:hypothetical protein Btru_011308 [Bulinus truncatus]|nr:hypothetical protein Btru_011308 [Bulinus truncatus]
MSSCHITDNVRCHHAQENVRCHHATPLTMSDVIMPKKLSDAIMPMKISDAIMPHHRKCQTSSRHITDNFPMAVNASSPMAVNASSPMAVNASSPMAVNASSPMAVNASSRWQSMPVPDGSQCQFPDGSRLKMFFLQVVLIADLLWSVNCECYSVRWYRYDFDDRQASCEPSEFYRALIIDRSLRSDQELFFMNGAECCSAPSKWKYGEKVVKYTDWTETLTANNSWASCPSGYFLAGLGRSSADIDDLKQYTNIVSGRCVRPAGHPLTYQHCYTKRFFHFSGKKKDICDCAVGFYVTGLHKSRDIDITYLQNIQCCSMVLESQEIQNFEEVKTLIMDRTLGHMATLADHLGFNYCKGRRGLACGEDFVRVGDNTWEASTRTFNENEKCSDLRCQERLTIVYGNWSIAVEYTAFENKFLENRETVINSGKITNKANRPLIVTFNATPSVPGTCRATHTVVRKFQKCPGFKNFQHFHPEKYAAEISAINVPESFSLSVGGYDIFSYKIIQRETVAIRKYEALIDVKFSATFQGLLKWSRTSYQTATNYHNMYARENKPVHFAYRFGNKEVPFRVAVKNESESRSMPWLWGDMLGNPHLEGLNMDRLKDQNLYQCMIKGYVQRVLESKLSLEPQ